MTASPVLDRLGVQVYAGDCLDVLRTLQDASVDAVVTDPPYGLADHRPDALVTALTAWVNDDRERVPDGKGFMGKSWDAFVPPPAVWDECLRVLKPGGHLLCFAGTRTVDLMGLSIRLAGFEIRDSIGHAIAGLPPLMAWVQGAGFPKGQNIGKAVDKMRDDRDDIVCITAYLAHYAEARGITRADVDEHMGTSDMAGWWLSRLRHRCQVPKWDQWLKLRDLIGFGDDMDAEVWRLNGRKGTPGNERADRVVTAPAGNSVFQPTQRVVNPGMPVLDEARQWEGWNTSLKPAWEPIIVARKPLADNTVAQTVLEYGTGALNIDGCRIRPASSSDEVAYRAKCASVVGLDSNRTGAAYGEWTGARVDSASDAGRWPTNVVFSHAPECGPDEAPGLCVDGCPVAELDAQSGITTSSDRPRQNTAAAHNRTASMGKSSGDWTTGGHADEGGASRFFPTFRYEEKASSSERPRVNGVAHPTVKPLDLLRWLVRLVTPPGGVVLDPFAGSGTTLRAARDEGFRAIGIEREPDYLPLIRFRLDAEFAARVPDRKAEESGQCSLFADADDEETG